MICRHCREDQSLNFIDLGAAPPSNAYLTSAQLSAPERWYPLRVFVCTNCWLVQTEDFAESEELFSIDYAYFSSFSDSWLKHAEHYARGMTERFGLDENSFVVEVASNDGYLLQYFRDLGIPNLGIEPTHSTAEAARARKIEVIEEFFGVATAEAVVASHGHADLTAANNVLAHVPDINDFLGGFATLLKPTGVSTFEFPHLQKLVDGLQFDTVYHEHFSYLSLIAVDRIFRTNGLIPFDVDEIETHGGSLRVYAQRLDAGTRPVAARLTELLEREAKAGMKTAAFYEQLQPRAERIKDDLLAFLIDAKREGKRVGAYGAAAKGNTLLNFGGVRGDLLPWVVDRNPSKQDKFMPGSRIPIVAEEQIRLDRPDYVLILPWNLKAEVTEQLGYIREWGGRFVTAVPEIAIA